MLEVKKEEHLKDVLNYRYFKDYILEPNDMVFTVKEMDVPLISCVYAYREGTVEIKDIVYRDDYSFQNYSYLVLMTVLNCLDLNGICDVYSSNTTLFPLYTKALFIEQIRNGMKIMYLDLNDYFTQHST